MGIMIPCGWTAPTVKDRDQYPMGNAHPMGLSYHTGGSFVLAFSAWTR
jgi:hypothetical protein